MYIKNGHKTHVQDIMYLKWRKEKDTNNPKIQIILTTSLKKNTPLDKNLLCSPSPLL